MIAGVRGIAFNAFEHAVSIEHGEDTEAALLDACLPQGGEECRTTMRFSPLA